MRITKFIFLLAAMLGMISGMKAQDNPPTTNWADNIGNATLTETENVIEITTAAQLALLAKNVNEGITDYSDKTIKLNGNINLSYHIWTPIGAGLDATKSFNGTFDGNSKVISGMYISGIEGNLGLFGNLGDDATVKNLILANSTIVDNDNGSSNDYGGIAAFVNTNTTITNCLVYKVSITAKGTNHPGAIIGYGSGNYANISKNLYFDCKCTDNSANQTNTTNIATRNGDLFDDCEAEKLTTQPTDRFSIKYEENYYAPKYCTVNTQNKQATLHQTFYKDGNWNTLCLPFNLSNWKNSSVFTNATIYEMEKENNNTKFDEEKKQIDIVFKTVGEDLTAGTPYLVKWPKDTEENATITSLTFNISSDEDIATGTTTPVTSNDGYISFIGVYGTQEFTANDRTMLFLGSNNALYYSTVGRSLGAYKAYFKLNGGLQMSATPVSNGVRVLLHGLDGETTAVEAVLTPAASADGEYYDLQGRRVTAPAKGIYVTNGKKVIIK